MKYKLIFLDGSHSGTVIDSMDAPPEYKLSILRAITIDGGELKPQEIEYETYKRTFISEDRRAILYSTDGDSVDSILNRRDWVVTPDTYYRKQEPVYFEKSKPDTRNKN